MLMPIVWRGQRFYHQMFRNRSMVSKDVDGIGQKDIPNSNAIINDIDIEFGDFGMDFDER